MRKDRSVSNVGGGAKALCDCAEVAVVAMMRLLGLQHEAPGEEGPLFTGKPREAQTRCLFASGDSMRAPHRRRRLCLALIAPVAVHGFPHPTKKKEHASALVGAHSCSELSGTQSGIHEVLGHLSVCDLETDSGGWTLIASGRSPPGGYGGKWYSDLMTLQPSGSTGYLWYEDELSAASSDMRFSCATRKCASASNCTFDADVVFYDTQWYPWIAGASNNEKRCFGAQRVRPRQCDLLTGKCTDEWVADDKELRYGERLCDIFSDDSLSLDTYSSNHR